MTQTTPQAPKSPLSDDAKQLTLTAANIVYDPKGVAMIKDALGNIKGAHDKTIPATVAMLATTLLHKMGERLDAIPEEQMWGKMGVVHQVLGSIFEVAKHLGYNAPHSALEPAYKIVEEQLDKLKGQPEQEQGEAPDNEQAERTQDAPMQGAMPPQAGPVQQAPAPMMGGM